MTIEPSREYYTLFKKKKKRLSLMQVLLFQHISFRRDEEVGMAKIIIIRGKCTNVG